MDQDLKPECRETLREVERFLDGELDPTLHVRIEQHLLGCSPCMQRAEFRRHLRILVARSCTESHVPQRVEARIVRMIREIDVTE